MVVVSESNRGNVTFSNCAFWGPCNQNAIINGQGAVTFSDCIFVQWDRNKEGPSAIQVNGGSAIIRSCNFMANSPQITVGENVSRFIASDNIVKGKVRIDNRAKNAVVRDNLGTE